MTGESFYHTKASAWKHPISLGQLHYIPSFLYGTTLILCLTHNVIKFLWFDTNALAWFSYYLSVILFPWYSVTYKIPKE